MVMRKDTLGEKEMNYTERAEAVNDNDHYLLSILQIVLNHIPNLARSRAHRRAIPIVPSLVLTWLFEFQSYANSLCTFAPPLIHKIFQGVLYVLVFGYLP